MIDGFRCESANVSGGDELQRFRAHAMPHRDEALAVEVRGDAIHVVDGAEDGVGYARGHGALDEVLFDVEFGPEMRDVGWICGAIFRAAAVAGGLHEMRHAVSDGGVDQGEAPGLFDGDLGGGAEDALLDGEDCVDVRWGGGKDGRGVIEVASEEVDG